MRNGSDPLALPKNIMTRPSATKIRPPVKFMAHSPIHERCHTSTETPRSPRRTVGGLSEASPPSDRPTRKVARVSRWARRVPRLSPPYVQRRARDTRQQIRLAWLSNRLAYPPPHGAPMPKAYWITCYREIKHPDKVAAYAKLAVPALAPGAPPSKPASKSAWW